MLNQGFAALLAVLLLGSPALAQGVEPKAGTEDAKPDAKPTRNFFMALIHNLGEDVTHLPRRNTMYLLIGGAAGALAAQQADRSVNRHLVGSAAADVFFAPGKYVGSPQVQVGTAIATYVIGRAANKPRVRHLGMDLLEAQILTEGIVVSAKAIGQRHRPINADGTSAPGYSFPSGHAAMTFAFATVLQQHLGWRAALPTYTLATYVATSRLHDNRHFLSDVVFGAVTGIIVGRTVTWHGRNTYTLAMVPRPGGLGAVITW